METATLYELIGYVASALIVLSLLMASVLKLRVINLAGALVFTVYGLLIGSLPVVVTNGAIVLIDVYHLVRIARDRAEDAYFEVLSVPTGSPVLRRFVDFHLDDIRRFQPDFPGLDDDQLAWMVLRDAVPVGAVLVRASPPADDGHGTARVPGSADVARAGSARLELDYVTAPHRDLRAGAVLHHVSSAFADRGIAALEATAEVAEHRRYLERMGFERRGRRWWREVAT